MNNIAYVGLGSNLGDRELNLLRGIAEIGKIPGSRITALSGFYDTEPVNIESTVTFYNAVLRLETALTPYQLLSELQRIETVVFRRKRSMSPEPRSMDLDILLFNDIVIRDPDLTIPHPRLHERRFALVPLAEIAPDIEHPVIGKTIGRLLRSLNTKEHVTRL